MLFLPMKEPTEASVAQPLSHLCRLSLSPIVGRSPPCRERCRGFEHAHLQVNRVPDVTVSLSPKNHGQFICFWWLELKGIAVPDGDARDEPVSVTAISSQAASRSMCNCRPSHHTAGCQPANTRATR